MQRLDGIFAELRARLPEGYTIEKSSQMNALLITDPQKNLGFALTAKGLSDDNYRQRFFNGLNILMEANAAS